MDDLTSYKTLFEKFNVTKQELEKAEKTLKAMTGPFGISDYPNRGKQDSSTVSKRSFVKNEDKKPKIKDLSHEHNLSEIKDLSQSEDSSDEHNLSVKHSIQSTVSKVRSIRSKKEVIYKQNVTPKIESRNRRILGMLQGTLRKFQDEAQQRKAQDLKRKKVEEKVEAAAKDEKERIKKQKLDLMLEKEEKQLQLKGLEEMLEITKYHEIWESNQKYLMNFIITKSKPQIYFLPAIHTEKSKKCLEKSKMEVWEKIEKRKSQVQKQLMDIEKIHHLENLQSKQFDSTHSENNTEENLEDTQSLPDIPLSVNAPEDDEECSVISLSLKHDDDLLII